MYKSLGRCNIEYSSQPWSPHNINKIHAIELVQYSMTRYIVGNNDLPYPEIVNYLTYYLCLTEDIAVLCNVRLSNHPPISWVFEEVFSLRFMIIIVKGFQRPSIFWNIITLTPFSRSKRTQVKGLNSDLQGGFMNADVWLRFIKDTLLRTFVHLLWT